MTPTEEQIANIIIRDELAKGDRGLYGRLLARGLDVVGLRPGPKPKQVRSAPRGTWTDGAEG